MIKTLKGPHRDAKLGLRLLLLTESSLMEGPSSENLSRITWAHAVNSKSQLETALIDDSIMMLEADVVYGTVISDVHGKPSEERLMPIMGHPPTTTSDLSLSDFLGTVANYHAQSNKSHFAKKGVKLDFKTTDVFLRSLDQIRVFYDRINFPLWLNADIISACKPNTPNDSPVDARVFLSEAKKFRTATLSIGWTTMGADGMMKYEHDHIAEMLDALDEARIDSLQPVTFPLRSGMATQSIEQIKRLLQFREDTDYRAAHPSTTITLWSAKDDIVDVTRLCILVRALGMDKVYLDLPNTLRDELFRQLNDSE